MHHYHYPTTNIWDSPLPKLLPAEVTDLSHLHALFDSNGGAAPPRSQHKFHFDVVDLGTTANLYAASSGTKTESRKPSSMSGWPTYSDVNAAATRRPSTYHAPKTKGLTTAEQQAYMAALQEYFRPRYPSSSSASWKSKPSMSYYPKEQSGWSVPTQEFKGHSSSSMGNYGWSYPQMYGYKGYTPATTKLFSSTPDNEDWPRQVASAYKSAAEKALSQASKTARYDTDPSEFDGYSSEATTTTTRTEKAESVAESESYVSVEKGETESPATLSSSTTPTPTELEAPEPPAATPADKNDGITSKKSPTK